VSATRATRWSYALAAGLVLFGLVFLGLLASRLARMLATIGWRETSCTIESARVDAWKDSDGDEHRVIDVTYRYLVDGVTRWSHRYDLWGNEKGDARAIVAGLAPGNAVRCFYDPHRPEDAVVDRRLDPGGLVGVLGLLPLLFGVHTARRTWRDRHRARRERQRHVELLGVRPRRLALRRLGASIASRLAFYGFFGPALLALSLHDRGGILGQLVRGEIRFLPGVWVVIVLAVEAAATALFVHTVMRALGPRFALATVHPARRGAPVVLQWRASGVTPSIRTIGLELVGREEADYQRGSGDDSESGTDTREFFRRVLVTQSRSQRRALAHGSVTVEVPPFAFSFDGGNNRVRWTVVLTADVAGWADVDEELEIDIAP
jgi:hypothetical protein